MIESVYEKGLCISLNRLRLNIDNCNMIDSRQRWNFDGKGSSKFEWRPLADPFVKEPKLKRSPICVTNQHHPSSGESLKIMSCRQAWKDETNYWTVY